MIPTRINLHKQSKTLELQYGDQAYSLPAEYLRVYSPSAEVKGHGPGQSVLQHGKRHVGIRHIEPAGNYALKITFDDGHDSGIYTWEYLRDLCLGQEARWQTYLDELHHAGKSRDPDTSIVKFID